MTSSSSEAETIERAMDGNQMALRTLHERYFAAAYRLACLLLGDTRDAEEVVQDAFVYAFRNLGNYDAEKGPFWTWLRVILVSRCRNKRRRKLLPRVSLELLRGVGLVLVDPKPDSNPVQVLERAETRRMIWEAIQRVSPGARDALVLRYFEGLSYSEMGDVLGCSEGAARSRVVHGKVQLRRLLAPSGGEAELEFHFAPIPEAGSR